LPTADGLVEAMGADAHKVKVLDVGESISV